MSVLKKYEAKHPRFVSCKQSRTALRLATRADEANSSDFMSERSRTSRLTFAQDFLVEHSHPGLQSTSIRMVGSF